MAEASATSTNIPSVMKAAQQSKYGEPRDVLTLRDDVPVPQQLSSNQVLVRVCAASINPIDWKIVNGNLSLVLRPSFPRIPGNDVAGVVAAVGSGVKRFQVGDQVYGNVAPAAGSYAEYVRGNESLFALKPKNLNMVEAAAVPLACETSYQALFKKISPPVGSGTKVFICGGSSATGLYAIQLAKAVGAQVATTASQRNVSFLEKLGFKLTQDKDEFKNDPQQVLVIDYNTKDFGEELRGENYDAVYDCIGGEQQWNSAQKILKQGGQFVTIVGDDTKSNVTVKAVASMGSSLVNRKFWSVFGSQHHSYIMHFLTATPEELDDIRVNYVEAGKVKPIIDTVYDWQKDGVEALHSFFEKSKSGKAQGKLVLKIADEQ